MVREKSLCASRQGKWNENIETLSIDELHP